MEASLDYLAKSVGKSAGSGGVEGAAEAGPPSAKALG